MRYRGDFDLGDITANDLSEISTSPCIPLGFLLIRISRSLFIILGQTAERPHGSLEREAFASLRNYQARTSRRQEPLHLEYLAMHCADEDRQERTQSDATAAEQSEHLLEHLRQAILPSRAA